MKIFWESVYNFDKKGSRGCAFDVLPFLRVFPPLRYGGYTQKKWTFHFGWIFWTVIFHLFKEPSK
jgi:hypothetical protein